jgi:phage terminase Nu1 subunit (DNA packaging protein)
MENLTKDFFTWFRDALAQTPLPKSVRDALANLTAILIAAILLNQLLRLAWKQLVVPIIERLWSAGKRAEVEERRTYARWVERMMEDINLDEDLRDDNYNELEAEVEIEGSTRALPFLIARKRLTRESSLSEALRKVRTSDNFAVVEGEPGSGKSVALRHVAKQVAEHAQRSPLGRGKLPVYVNLKSFGKEYAVTHDDLERFIVDSLSEAAPDIRDILQRRFHDYLVEGRWIFLFDSFDEIPAIMAAREDEAIIEEYARLLYLWLGATQSVALVASRDFHGIDRRVASKTFRILKLSKERQAEQVRRAYLARESENTLLTGIQDPPLGMEELVVNPMWLGLIISHVRSGQTFPRSARSVFDAYITAQLTAGIQRVPELQGGHIDELKRQIEAVAFCMTADPQLENVATPNEIRAGLAREQLEFGHVEVVLSGLLQTKIMRRAKGLSRPEVTFRHRRLQEYLAAGYLSRHPDRVPAEELLTSGRWREITVSMIQDAEAAGTRSLIAKTENLIRDYSTNILDSSVDLAEAPTFSDLASGKRFDWPAGSRHLLSIIANSTSRPSPISHEGNEAAGQLLVTAARMGNLVDQKWAVDLSSTADGLRQDWLVDEALKSTSLELQDSAFAQIGRLTRISKPVRRALHRNLLAKWSGGRRWRDRVTYEAEIRRLNEPEDLIRAARLLRFQNS